MVPVEVFLFGAPRLDRAGESLTLHRTRGLGLLAYLAVTRQPHTRDALAALLWPDFGQTDARNNLRRELSLLKKEVGGELLAIERTQIGINTTALDDGRLWLDIAEFESLVAATDTHRHGDQVLCAECAQWLEQAEALATADFLAGFTLPYSPAFEEWQYFEAERLRSALDSVRERLTGWYLAQGQLDRAVEMSRRRLAADALNEPAQRDLLRGLAQSGQQGAALREYGRFAALLADELDQAPEPATLALVEAIRAHELGPVSASAAPVGATQAARPVTVESGQPQKRHNLPGQSTPFLGREQELLDLTQLVNQSAARLVTIVGPGGMGKTRLALAWAGRYLNGHGNGAASFRDGIYFVNLAPLVAADQIIPVLAEALGYPLQGGEHESRPPRQQVIDYLANKQLLLLLDNFEHLVDAADLLIEILENAPGVLLLATSRERLNMRQEQVYPIQGLTFPDWETPEDAIEYAAVRLFLQSARRNNPDFALSAGDDLLYLARISRLVDGMPLALELAAAWVDVLSLEEIAAEIQQGLGLLETEMRDVPERQRSVRATIDYSWQKLDEVERRVFSQLSVFRGSFSREAAAAVTGASLRTLSRLVHKSLLQVDQTTHRYQIHELLRQYGVEQLARDEELAAVTHDRHAEYFAQFLADAERELTGAADTMTMRRLARDIDNCEAAFRWLLQRRQAAPLVKAFNGLCFYYHFRLRVQDGWDLCDRLLATFSDPVEVEEKLLIIRATNWSLYYSYEHAFWRDGEGPTYAQALLNELQAEGLDLANDRAFTLYLLTDADQTTPYFEPGADAMREALALFEQTGNSWGISITLNWLVMGSFYSASSGYEASLAYARRALAYVTALGNLRLQSGIMSILTSYALQSGNFEMIDRLLPEVAKNLARYHARDISAESQQLLESYGLLLAAAGRNQEALDAIEQRFRIRAELGVPTMTLLEQGYGQMLSHVGDYDRAGEHYRYGLALARGVSNTWVEALFLVMDGMRHIALADLDGAEQLLLAALEVNKEAKIAVDWAGNIGNLMLVRYRRESDTVDRPSLARALGIAVSHHSFFALLEVLPVVALVLGATDPRQVERATELYGALMANPYYANSQQLQDMSGKLLAELVQTLPPVRVGAAIERGRAMDLWEAAAEVLDEIEALGWRDGESGSG